MADNDMNFDLTFTDHSHILSVVTGCIAPFSGVGTVREKVFAPCTLNMVQPDGLVTPTKPKLSSSVSLPSTQSQLTTHNL